MKKYSKGHYAQARRRFIRAVSRDPYNPDYRHNLAMVLQKQGDASGSEQILRYNLTMDAMHQPTYHSLAQLMIAQGRAPEAQDLLTSWAVTQPYVPEANIEMAWLQRETGDVAGAEHSLQNALRADPGHPVALAQLGQLYEGAGRPDQAVAYYQRSLASNWNQPEVQSQLANMMDSRPTTRSAMMQNSIGTPMMAQGSMFGGDPMMASADSMMAPPMMTYQMPPAEMMSSSTMMTANSMGNQFGGTEFHDADSNREVRRRHQRHRGMNNPTMASYPMPNYGTTSTGWYPANSIDASAMTYQDPSMSQISAAPLTPPQMAGSISTPYATIPAGPTPIAQADPAHANEANQDVTASLPIVDPH